MHNTDEIRDMNKASYKDNILHVLQFRRREDPRDAMQLHSIFKPRVRVDTQRILTLR